MLHLMSYQGQIFSSCLFCAAPSPHVDGHGFLGLWWRNPFSCCCHCFSAGIPSHVVGCLLSLWYVLYNRTIKKTSYGKQILVREVLIWLILRNWCCLCLLCWYSRAPVVTWTQPACCLCISTDLLEDMKTRRSELSERYVRAWPTWQRSSLPSS